MTKLPKDLQEQVDQLTLEQKKQLIDYLIDRVETQQEQSQQETRVLLARLYTLNSNLFLPFSSASSWAQMRDAVKTKEHEKVKEPDKSLEFPTPSGLVKMRMNLLFDTHTLIWWDNDHSKL